MATKLYSAHRLGTVKRRKQDILILFHFTDIMWYLKKPKVLGEYMWLEGRNINGNGCGYRDLGIDEEHD